MNKVILSLLTLTLMSSIQGQEIIKLWPNKVPNKNDKQQQESSEQGDILWITNVSDPTITVYLPTPQLATGQSVLIFPGGGYAGLAFDWEGIDIAKWFNSKGIAAFVVKYRLPEDDYYSTPWEVPLQDAQRSMRIVRASATKWKINPDKIGIIGFSAGGHLASTLGTHYNQDTYVAVDASDKESARPDFMILVYPVISFIDEKIHTGSKDNLIGKKPDKELEKLYSNELQVEANTPPTLLIHASDDEGVPPENSLLFYRALIANNVPAEMHIYPYGGHGFSLATGRGYLSTWPDRMADWLEADKKE